MTKSLYRRVDHDRTVHVTAVSPLPGVRPALMLADYQPPEGDRPESWDVYPVPVLGVQTVRVETWFIVVGEGEGAPPFPGTPAAARRAGWQQDAERSRVEYLVQIDGEIAPQTVLDFELSQNTACRAFVATWPPAEDVERLGDQLGELKAWAKQRWLDSQGGGRRPGDGSDHDGGRGDDHGGEHGDDVGGRFGGRHGRDHGGRRGE